MSEQLEVESIFDKYKREMGVDLEIDRITLEEKTLKTPALKGKWIARLMTHKKERSKLNELYDTALDQITEKIIKESPIGLSKPVAARQAETHELIKKIKTEIKEQEHVIEYLEKMEKVLSNMTYDIKNETEIIKLETT